MEMSHPRRDVSDPPTAPPMPMNATCPRLTWPAQPVSTTSETPTIEKMTITVARLSLASERNVGTRSTKARTSAPMPQKNAADLGQSRELGRHRPDLVDGLPVAHVAGAGRASGAARRAGR